VFDEVYILFHCNIILKHNEMSSTKAIINRQARYVSQYKNLKSKVMKCCDLICFTRQYLKQMTQLCSTKYIFYFTLIINVYMYDHTKLPTWCTEYYLFVKYYYSPLHVSSIKYSSSGGHSCTQAAYGTVTLYKSPRVLLICSYRENWLEGEGCWWVS